MRPNFFRIDSFTHPWIHEGGHGEVDEDKEGDDTLEDGNSIPVLLQNVPFDTPEVECKYIIVGVKSQNVLTGSRRTRLWCPKVEAMQMWLEGTWFWICILASWSRRQPHFTPQDYGSCIGGLAS